jgi:RNA polymerase sigma-70 factor (ECF subfamily)
MGIFMKIPDEILVQRVLDGDKSSFGILVERYKCSVFQHAIKTTRDFHEAEDITQDVFLKAYLNLQKLREPTKFGGWLRGITQNLCRKWIHKKRMLSDLEIPLDNLQTEVLNQWLKEQDNSESWEFGTEVAQKLSDEQKALLKLFYIDDCSCRDIAQQMGATEAAIRQRLSRTRLQLKTELLEGENMNNMIVIGAICAFLLGGTLAWAGTLKDDFSDGNFEGWTESNPWGLSASWAIDNRELIGISKSVAWDAHLYLNNSHSWKDYNVSVKVKIVEVFSEILCGAGIFVRRTNPKDYVQFSILLKLVDRGPSVQCYEMNGDKWEESTKPFEIKLDTWYNLAFMASGNQFKCYVDGSKVMDCKYEKFAHGAVGVAINGAEIHFDNFVVTGDDVPDMNLSIEPQEKLASTWGHIRQAD